jgi:ribosomal protein L6P/L9E
MFNLNAGHHRRFMVVGYNYRIKPFKKRRYLMLKIGYFYRIIMKIPDSLKICPKKRFSVIIGTNRIIFDSSVDYIRNLRNLYPYKKKGFVYRNEYVRIKKGKKTRFR